MNKIVSFLATAAFVLAVTILFTTCEKDYSFEGGIFTAPTTTSKTVYTFYGAGGACAGAVASGQYYPGVALGPANTIQLEVDVDSIGGTGSFSIHTNVINGMQFSASGTFTDTGRQAITLIGSGTPTAEGNFSFNTAPVSGCSFAVTVQKVPPSVAKFTLASAPGGGCETVSVHGVYEAGVQLNSSNVVVVFVNVNVVGDYTLSTDTLNGIYFYAEGKFTTLGKRSIIMNGYGVPTVPANLTFTPKAGGSGCTFQVPVLNQNPVATYVLESGGGALHPCIYTLAGSYTTHTPLSATNTVTVRVYVTIIGNFTIATSPVNGIMFYYTGTFTKVGPQDVILKGTGTPLVSDTTILTPMIVGPAPLGGESCGIKVPVN